MPLLKDGVPVEDSWRYLEPGESVPATGHVIVDFATLDAYRPNQPRAGRLGVVLQSDEPAAKLAPYVDGLSLVALTFPAYTDGRAYSTATILRRQYGYTGELRACGNVLVDQYQFMLQCGFDSFEIADRPWVGWQKAKVWMGVTYQAPTGNGARNALEGRRAAGVLF